MPLPGENNEISFSDINEELGLSSNAQLDLDSAAEAFSLSRPHNMNEFWGLSFNTFTFDVANVTGFQVANDGTVTPPSSQLGTITSRVYSSGYNSSTNKFPTVGTDTTRTVNVIVRAPSSGYSNNNQLVSGSKTAVQSAIDTYSINTWLSNGGAISINGQTGVVSLDNSGDSTTTPTFTPTSFSTFTSPSSQQQNVTVGNITVPSSPVLYTNSGNTISGTIQVTQLAYVLPAFTLSDWTGTISIDGQDGSISATSGNVSSVNIDTANFQTVSSGVNRTVQFDLIGIPSGYSNTGGDLNNQTKTVFQPAYVEAPSLSLNTLTSWDSNDSSTLKTLIGTNNGGTPDTLYFEMYSSDFKFVEKESNTPVVNPIGDLWRATPTNKTGTTFKVDIRPTGTNTGTQNLTADVDFYGVNDGGSSNPDTTVTQSYPVTWNATVSSLSFTSAGGYQSFQLNTSEAWSAFSYPTSFKLGTNSSAPNTLTGTAGNPFIYVYKAASDLGGTGTVTISASGQDDIVISLSQSPEPLSYYYYINGSSTGETTQTRSLGTLSYLGESVSIGLYTYRGSTAVSSTYILDVNSGGAYSGVGLTTSQQSVSEDISTTQNTGANAATIYLNVDSNSGNSSTRSGQVELSITSGGITTSYVLFNWTQAADPSAGGSGNGDGGDRLDEKIQ